MSTKECTHTDDVYMDRMVTEPDGRFVCQDCGTEWRPPAKPPEPTHTKAFIDNALEQGDGDLDEAIGLATAWAELASAQAESARTERLADIRRKRADDAWSAVSILRSRQEKNKPPEPTHTKAFIEDALKQGGDDLDEAIGLATEWAELASTQADTAPSDQLADIRRKRANEAWNAVRILEGRQSQSKR